MDVLMGIFMLAVISIGSWYFWQSHKTREKLDQARTQAVAALLTSLPTLTPTFTRTPTPTASVTPTPSNTHTPQNTATLKVQPSVRYLAPDFSLAELASGEEISLSQFAGQPVLVVFWATWCPHCLNEMPALNELQKNYGEKGLVLLAINVGESQASVSSYKIRNNLTFRILLDPQKAVEQKYKVTGIPAHFFIKPNGVISYIFAGGLPYKFLESQAEALFK